MRSVGGVCGGGGGRRKRGKRKFSQCQMEEQLAPLSLQWGWIFLCRTGTHTRTIAQTNTHMQSYLLSLHTTCPAPGHQSKTKEGSHLWRERGRNESSGGRSGWAPMPYAFTFGRSSSVWFSANHQFTWISFLSSPATLILLLSLSLSLSLCRARVIMRRQTCVSVSRPRRRGKRGLSSSRWIKCDTDGWSSFPLWSKWRSRRTDPDQHMSDKTVGHHQR